MWLMIAMIGMSALSSISSAASQQESNKLQNKLRKAQNTRLMISAFNSIGRVNENKIQAAQQSQGVARAMQQEELHAIGTAQVASGAAGVRGRSIDQAFASINRAAATKELQREDELRSVMNAYEAQMDNIWESGVNSLDITPDASESFNTLGVAASIGMSAFSAFNQRSTAFNTITGTTGQLTKQPATTTVGATGTANQSWLGSIFAPVGRLLGL